MKEIERKQFNANFHNHGNHHRGAHHTEKDSPKKALSAGEGGGGGGSGDKGKTSGDRLSGHTSGYQQLAQQEKTVCPFEVTGSCYRGAQCDYDHNPSSVMVEWTRPGITIPPNAQSSQATPSAQTRADSLAKPEGPRSSSARRKAKEQRGKEAAEKALPASKGGKGGGKGKDSKGKGGGKGKDSKGKGGGKKGKGAAALAAAVLGTAAIGADGTRAPTSYSGPNKHLFFGKVHKFALSCASMFASPQWLTMPSSSIIRGPIYGAYSAVMDCQLLYANSISLALLAMATVRRHLRRLILSLLNMNSQVIVLRDTPVLSTHAAVLRDAHVCPLVQ